jgi:ribosomal protein S18 acetylase RimI-like enzyme
MVTIEPFAPADLPALRRLMDDYATEFDPYGDPREYWDDEHVDAWLAGASAGTHTIWLARTGGSPIAFALVRKEQHWYRRSRCTGIIEEFYVAPAHRRRGIGQRLAAHAMEGLRAQGVQIITASVLQMNLRALLFWQRVGFKIVAYHLFCGHVNDAPVQ